MRMWFLSYDGVCACLRLLLAHTSFSMLIQFFEEGDSMKSTDYTVTERFAGANSSREEAIKRAVEIWLASEFAKK